MAMAFDDLSGRQFGIWKVLEFDHMKLYRYGKGDTHGISYYKCRCLRCGGIFLVQRPNLLNCKNVKHHGSCLEGGESR